MNKKKKTNKYIFKFYKCNGKVFQGTFYLNSKLYGFPS